MHHVVFGILPLPTRNEERVSKRCSKFGFILYTILINEVFRFGKNRNRVTRFTQVYVISTIFDNFNFDKKLEIFFGHK